MLYCGKSISFGTVSQLNLTKKEWLSFGPYNQLCNHHHQQQSHLATDPENRQQSTLTAQSRNR